MFTGPLANFDYDPDETYLEDFREDNVFVEGFKA